MKWLVRNVVIAILTITMTRLLLAAVLLTTSCHFAIAREQRAYIVPFIRVVDEESISVVWGKQGERVVKIKGLRTIAENDEQRDDAHRKLIGRWEGWYSSGRKKWGFDYRFVRLSHVSFPGESSDPIEAVVAVPTMSSKSVAVSDSWSPCRDLVYEGYHVYESFEDLIESDRSHDDSVHRFLVGSDRRWRSLQKQAMQKKSGMWGSQPELAASYLTEKNKEAISEEKINYLKRLMQYERTEPAELVVDLLYKDYSIQTVKGKTRQIVMENLKWNQDGLLLNGMKPSNKKPTKAPSVFENINYRAFTITMLFKPDGWRLDLPSKTTLFSIDGYYRSISAHLSPKNVFEVRFNNGAYPVLIPRIDLKDKEWHCLSLCYDLENYMITVCHNGKVYAKQAIPEDLVVNGLTARKRTTASFYHYDASLSGGLRGTLQRVLWHNGIPSDAQLVQLHKEALSAVVVDPKSVLRK